MNMRAGHPNPVDLGGVLRKHRYLNNGIKLTGGGGLGGARGRDERTRGRERRGREG